MKIRVITVLLMLAVLVSSTTACTTKDSYLVQVMQLAPENVEGVTCVDIKTMSEDPDLENWYDNMSDSLSYYVISGIEASEISGFASFEIDHNGIYVYIGDFNLEDVRNALIAEDLIEGEYKGVEIWTSEHDNTVAFISNMITFGYKNAVEACIRVHKNEESSMYDNADMKAVADRLPAAIYYMVFGPYETYDIAVLSGGICWGNSTSGDGVMDISVCYRFDSKASAEAAMTNDIEGDFSEEYMATNVEATLNGQFIEFTGEVEIPEY